MFEHPIEFIFAITGFAAALVGTYFGVEFFRRLSVRLNIMDHPNARSSHSEPTPRGGGAVILLAALVLSAAFSLLYSETFPWGFIGGAVIIATVSWLDDVFEVPSPLRLAAHFAGAAVLASQFGIFQSIYLPILGAEIETGVFGAVLTLASIVWLINAFNFMDGIDGMAGLQGAAAGFGWLIFGMISGLPFSAFLGGVTAFSCLGFLFHNWQPAKIFLGDVGSSFLGFTFAAMPLMAAAEKPSPGGRLPIVGLLFVWLIFLDSSITFLRRLIAGRPFWRAHREHFYQRHIISGKSHGSVSKIYGLAASIIASVTILALWRGGFMEVVLAAAAVLVPAGVFWQSKKGLT